MKQKLLTRMILGAFAGVAAAGAFAGQIQSSSVSIAREAVTDNTQAILSPSVAYRFAGDVDARVQDQTFQVQFTLGNGALWAAAPGATTISVSDGVSGLLLSQATGADGGDYNVLATGLSADKTTAWATIRVNKHVAGIIDGSTAATGAAVELVKQPLISINVTNNRLGNADVVTDVNGTATNVSAARGTINNLYATTGDIVNDYTNNVAGTDGSICKETPVMPVSFKHFTALTNPLAMATTSDATEDEHTRGGSTNTATLMTFPTNILPVIAKSTGDARINPAQGNTRFTGTASGAGTAADFLVAYRSPTTINLGSITLTQNGTGYDRDLATQYLLANPAAPAGVKEIGPGPATSSAGLVEGNTLVATVSSTNGFPLGASLWLTTDPYCGTGVPGGSAAATLNNAGWVTYSTAVRTIAAGDVAAASVDVTAATGDLNNLFGATSGNAAVGTGPAYVCMTNAAAVIPQAQFSAVARLKKAKDAPAAGGQGEQDDICNGPLYSLGGGVKIDVRNYANSAQMAANGWMSVIRLINNSETRSADVWGQIIQADGKYGPWGKLADLAPLQVLNMTAADVDAKLTSAPASANNGASTATYDAVRGGSRLRIVSNTGTTLRVQNYLYNPASQNFIEASSTQGVDFDGPAGMIDRAPGSEGQYQLQDAFKSLNGN